MIPTYEFFNNGIKDFKEVILSISEEFGDVRFLDLCRDKDADPFEDFKNIQKFIEKSYGFTMDKIKKLFDVNSFNDFINKNELDQLNGYVDIYLFYVNKKLNLNSLGGIGGVYIDENDGEDTLIKYAYGYHKTKYGQILLEENSLTAKSFIELVCKKQMEELINNVNQYISELEEDVDFSKYCTYDDDRYIIHYSDFKSKISIEKIKDLLSSDLKDGLKDKTTFLDTGEDFIVNFR